MLNVRQNHMFNQKAKSLFHHLIRVQNNRVNVFRIFRLCQFFGQNAVNVGHVGKRSHQFCGIVRNGQCLAAAPKAFDKAELNLVGTAMA